MRRNTSIIGDFSTGCSTEVCVFERQFLCLTGAGHTGMCPYTFFQYIKVPASSPDRFFEGQSGCIFFLFFGPPSTGGAEFFYPPGTPGHPGDHPGLDRCLDEVGDHVFEVGHLWYARSQAVLCSEHISPSQEAVGSVHSLPDLIFVVLDSPRDIPLAIHNIAQVGVLVGGVDFLALQGHISGQLPTYSHYPALGGIHSHFPSVRPFGYGIQRGLQIG
ncbi:hypothetical protein AYI69_g10284 [Smittium culicis]|uniref:Uncharacterized protein n=1 Tax=Smittium culicis TaxID=133412 RepID=A0A1R1X6T4_9FUNG|nr:hypothetical protein AYI69_g10284 [Smittium culicis]